jgi:hypothetical protein
MENHDQRVNYIVLSKKHRTKATVGNPHIYALDVIILHIRNRNRLEMGANQKEIEFFEIAQPDYGYITNLKDLVVF